VNSLNVTAEVNHALNVTTVFVLFIYHVGIKKQYELPSYIGSLAMVCR